MSTVTVGLKVQEPLAGQFRRLGHCEIAKKMKAYGSGQLEDKELARFGRTDVVGVMELTGAIKGVGGER